MKKEMITWEDKEYSINQLLSELNISKTSFYRHKNKGCTTFEAIKTCLDSKRSTYIYKGQLCNIYSLSEKLQINVVTIYKYVKLGYSLDECIPKILENKKVKYNPTKNQKVKITYFPYKQDNLTLVEIAKRENISSSNLYRRVMVENQSLEIAIAEIKRNQKLRKHSSFLVEELARGIKFENISLFQYCINQGYNYRTIIEKIIKYNMSVDDAVNFYIIHGQSKLSNNIYQHGKVALKHLFMKYHLNSNYAMQLKDNYKNIDDLIVKLCFSGKNTLYNKYEGLYLYELYSLFSICSEEERTMWIKELGITSRQIELLEMEHKRISFIQREFLYYELEPILETCSKEEQVEIINVYGITSEELDYINNRLYQDFTLVDTKKGPIYIKNISNINKKLTK